MSLLKNWKFWVSLIVVLVWARMPWFIHNNYQLQVLFRITLFAALGLAWNLVGGYAGQLSLGHVAFFGVGAYGLALFAAARHSGLDLCVSGCRCGYGICRHHWHNCHSACAARISRLPPSPLRKFCAWLPPI